MIPARRETEASPSELSPEETARVHAASAWTAMFSRTYKTCRLYERTNPTGVTLRAELATALEALLRAHGPLTLSFTSDEVLCHGRSVGTGRSREDNIGMPFFRDGIRALTFEPGIPARELDALLDALLRATGFESGEEDLVTLLWDAELHYVDVDFITFTGDLESGTELSPESASAPVRSHWPNEGDVITTLASGASTAPCTEPDAGPGAAGGLRSEDRPIADSAGNAAAALNELRKGSEQERARFIAELDGERERPLVRSALGLLEAAMATARTEQDRAEIAKFAPRVLREALGTGDWDAARGSLVLLRRNVDADGTIEAFLQELELPHSLTSRQALARLDQQDGRGLEDFLELSAELGESATEWLMRILAESERQRVRKPLALALAELCRGNPERLAPWLGDPRWYVVRNVVHTLGRIGGRGIAVWLRVVARHEEPRVRREVVWALAQADPEEAAPLGLELLAESAMPLYGQLLRMLAAHPSSALAEHLMSRVGDPQFAECSLEERRLVHGALAACSTDEWLPALEAELLRGSWMPFGPDEHRQAIAHCIAKVGTPAARAVLERGMQSRKLPVRRACTDALARLVSHD